MRSAWWIACVACGSAPSAPAPPVPPTPFTITTAPALVEPGVVSSEHTEIRLAVSPDGATLLWGSTDRAGGPGGWDIWRSRRSAAGWSAPAAVSFDSDANDFDPAFSADGRWVYFFSNRAGGAGGDDIYRVAVEADGFGAVQHLGGEINTAGDEWAPAPSPDGTRLMFASNRPGGKHDLMIARVVGTGFAPAAPVPGAINTPDADEFDATFLPGGEAIVFSRSRDVEKQPIALYVARLGGAATALPDTVNVAGGYTLGPAVHGDTLYFSSVRPAPSAGKMDIYSVRFTGSP